MSCCKGCFPDRVCTPLQKFSEESLEFQRRISQRNGLSEETYLPPALHSLPPTVTMETAREEARMVLFGAVQDVLDRTGRLTTCVPAPLAMHPAYHVTVLLCMAVVIAESLSTWCHCFCYGLLWWSFD